jgi:BMFP domain-containing protein YqiC
MLNPKILDDLSARLAELAASGPAQRPGEECPRAAERSSSPALDFVPREEFEVQREVLARTREKLEALEAASPS